MPPHPPHIVLAAIDGGLSIGKAAAKFGVPRGTVASWVSRRRHRGEHGGKPKQLRIVPEAVVVGLPPPKPHAREATAIAVGEALGRETKDDLRDAVRSLTTHIANRSRAARDGQKVDMIQLANAARALDAMLTKAADILAFDKRIEEQATPDLPDMETEEGREEVARRLRALPASMQALIGRR